MFRGYNKPRKSDIFGPSSIGGTSVDSRERQLYQSGEGFGSFISSLFKKVVPTVGKAIQKSRGQSPQRPKRPIGPASSKDWPQRPQRLQIMPLFAHR